jgi:hypothetical protein
MGYMFMTREAARIMTMLAMAQKEAIGDGPA